MNTSQGSGGKSSATLTAYLKGIDFPANREMLVDPGPRQRGRQQPHRTHRQAARQGLRKHGRRDGLLQRNLKCARTWQPAGCQVLCAASDPPRRAVFLNFCRLAPTKTTHTHR